MVSENFFIKLNISRNTKKGDVALAVVSPGVAATLLHGGWTAHLALRLPLNFNLTEESTCNIIDNPSTCNILKKPK